MLLPQCPVEVEECIFSVVLQVLTACGWEEGRGVVVGVQRSGALILTCLTGRRCVKACALCEFSSPIKSDERIQINSGHLLHGNGNCWNTMSKKQAGCCCRRKLIFTTCATCARERFQTHLQMKTEMCWSFFLFCFYTTLETQWATTALNTVFVSKCWQKHLLCYCLSLATGGSVWKHYKVQAMDWSVIKKNPSISWTEPQIVRHVLLNMETLNQSFWNCVSKVPIKRNKAL